MLSLGAPVILSKAYDKKKKLQVPDKTQNHDLVYMYTVHQLDVV